MTDDEGITLWNPGTQLSIVGNAILILFPSEDDAIVALELLKSMAGKQVTIHESEV